MSPELADFHSTGKILSTAFALVLAISVFVQVVLAIQCSRGKIRRAWLVVQPMLVLLAYWLAYFSYWGVAYQRFTSVEDREWLDHRSGFSYVAPFAISVLYVVVVTIVGWIAVRVVARAYRARVAAGG